MSNFVYTYVKDEMPKHLNFVLKGILPTCPTLFIPMSKMKCILPTKHQRLNFVLEGILPTCPTLFIPMSKMKCLNI